MTTRPDKHDPQSMAFQLSRIGGALNPLEVSHRIRMADLGNMRDLQDLDGRGR